MNQYLKQTNQIASIVQSNISDQLKAIDKASIDSEELETISLNLQEQIQGLKCEKN